MSTITELLKQEEHLNELLNTKPRPDDIHEQFKALFTNPYYKATQTFLCTTWFAGVVHNFSQNKEGEQYITQFTLDNVTMFKEVGDYQFDEIGNMKNAGLLIKGTSPFNDITNKCLHNILMDEDNKEIAFIFYDYDEHNNKINIEHISYHYTEISFINGVEKLYAVESKNPKAKM